MIRYKGLTHFDVDTFVEEVIVKDTEWLSGNPEILTVSHIFVCSHTSRYQRCGFCGPALIKRLKEDIESWGLKDHVVVSPYSHSGGHKYAGNLIIYGPNADGEVTGHWYGYVTPNYVSILLDQHFYRSIWTFPWQRYYEGVEVYTWFLAVFLPSIAYFTQGRRVDLKKKKVRYIRRVNQSWEVEPKI